MSVEVRITCPLGHACEKVGDDGKLERCAWYVQLRGKSPQGETTMDEWRCALAWQPILSVEMSMTNRGQTAALESFRNETVRRQDAALRMQAATMDRRIVAAPVDVRGLPDGRT